MRLCSATGRKGVVSGRSHQLIMFPSDKNRCHCPRDGQGDAMWSHTTSIEGTGRTWLIEDGLPPAKFLLSLRCPEATVCKGISAWK